MPNLSKIIGGLALLAILPTCSLALAKEYHVAKTGDDKNNGSLTAPFKTISAATKVVQAGETITVHAGVYRERINPTRGGISNEERITYQAAKDEKVIIKGSIIAKNWTKIGNDSWKTTIPNSTFGKFNPFNDQIRGDWFISKGRTHHTGAVYLNGHWLTEAKNLETAIKPFDKTALWFATVNHKDTTIVAQFKDVNPNQQLIEVNARQSVFYPAKPGINYITVRGFTLEQAATNWAPPTAEQVGIIGTHWSKGWIIE
ncbi:MAG: DUF1565 domain-containing protein, partial [Lentisphaeria bacterium]|nr:DUF1565 domain-containing protein [Lentisphaeria bacterium]